MSGFDNEFGGGTFKIIDAIPPATPTTGGGIADTPAQTELFDALGMDELVQAASDPFQKQIYYPDGVNYYYSFGDYFVFANKNPLPESLNGVVGFSRDALFTETGNTAIVSAETLVSPQNNVRDPVRKVTRNIWTSTDDFKNVELFGSPTAFYDDDLTFAKNVGNADFNKEKMPVVVFFPAEQSGQDDVYTTSGRGEPIRKNKLLLAFPQRPDRDEGFERAEGLAFLAAMFKPDTRTDLGYEVVVGSTAIQPTEPKAEAEAYFKENGWAPEGWSCTVTGDFSQITNPEEAGYHMAEVGWSDGDSSAKEGWECYFDDIINKPVCAPIPSTMGSVVCVKQSPDLVITDMKYVIDIPKIGSFDVKPAEFNMPRSDLIGYNFEFADHTFEMGLPFPIVNADLSNLSANSLLGDYDIIFNDTDKDLKYENFVKTHYLYEGVCAYTLASAELNEAKGVKNPIYQDLIGKDNVDNVSDVLVNQPRLKKYLDAYVDNFQRGITYHKNKNVLIRDKEVAVEVRKIAPIVPAAIRLSFENRQEPDFSKILKATGYDVVLMSKVAENFTEKEAAQPTAYDNDPTNLSLTSMIKDVVMTSDEETIEEATGGAASVPEPIPVNFLDIKSEDSDAYDLIKFFHNLSGDPRDDFRDILNKSIETQVLVENEETDFKIYDSFMLKKYSAQLCKAALMQKATERTRSVFDIYSGKKCAHEILFFRIEKRKTGSPSPVPLQNFFVFNDGQDIIDYLDTQVEYGVGYTYRIFAYTLVFGTKYQPFLDDPDWDSKSMVTTGLGDASPFKVSFLYKPSVQLIEVPYHTYTNMTVLDSPPLPPQIQFYPYKYEGDKIFISLANTNGFVKEEPILIKSGDEERFNALRKAQKLNDKVIFESDDEPHSYEVYRTDSEPAGYGQIPLHTVLNVRTEGKGFIDHLTPNRDYWYFFRAVDTHGNFSNPTMIYKLRLIVDGVSYLKVSRMEHSAVVPEEGMKFSKFIEIDHSRPETALHASNAEIYGKTMKVRIKSLETGKKVDLNIDFSKTQLTNPETETI